MDKESEARSVPDIYIWLLWTLATVAPATLVFVLSSGTTFVLQVEGMTEQVAFANDNVVGPMVLFALSIVILLIPLMVLSHGVVLRLGVKPVKWPLRLVMSLLLVETCALVLVSACGLMLAWLIDGRYLAEGFVVATGVAFGLGELPMVRLQRPVHGVWWVVANGAAWLLGLLGGQAAARLVSQGYFDEKGYHFPFYPLESAIYWAIGWAVAAAIIGAVTGLMLVILRQRNLQESTAR